MYGVMNEGIISNLTDVSVFIKKPRQFEWNPQPSITAYELALCLPFFFAYQNSQFGEDYDKLPENAKRHFVEK